MLDPVHTRAGGGLALTFPYVADNNDLPATLEFWIAHVTRDLLQLGVHFRALAIMCEIPGGARRPRFEYGPCEALPESDRPCYWLRNTDRAMLLNVLAECLRRLGAGELFPRIRETRSYWRCNLPQEWKAYVDRHARLKGGLLSIVACCIDILVVEPGLAEIEAKAAWWQRWWPAAEQETQDTEQKSGAGGHRRRRAKGKREEKAK